MTALQEWVESRSEKIVGQLLFGQVIAVVLEIITDAANCATIGFDGFGLEPLELEVLQVFFEIALEFSLVR